MEAREEGSGSKDHGETRKRGGTRDKGCAVERRWLSKGRLKGGLGRRGVAKRWRRRGGETYVNTCCYTREGTSVRGSFSETAYSAADKEKKTSLTSRNDVWRQFYCAFHSVGRFEIQARILLCPSGGTEGQARQRNGEMYRCTED